MYGLYDLKHHTVEICGDVTDADRRANDKQNRATQLLICEPLSFANLVYLSWVPISTTAEGDPVESSERASERSTLKFHRWSSFTIRVVPHQRVIARRRVLDGDVVKGDGRVGLPPLVLISADHQCRWIFFTLQNQAKSDRI